LKLRQQGIDLHRATLEHFSKTVYTPKDSENRQWVQQMPTGEKESLKWLL
jgi:hypothetical protein